MVFWRELRRDRARCDLSQIRRSDTRRLGKNLSQRGIDLNSDSKTRYVERGTLVSCSANHSIDARFVLWNSVVSSTRFGRSRLQTMERGQWLSKTRSVVFARPPSQTNLKNQRNSKYCEETLVPRVPVCLQERIRLEKDLLDALHFARTLARRAQSLRSGRVALSRETLSSPLGRDSCPKLPRSGTLLPLWERRKSHTFVSRKQKGSSPRACSSVPARARSRERESSGRKYV